MDKPESLKNMINITVNLMTNNMTSLSTKKHDPNPSQKINHNLRKILWNLTLLNKYIYIYCYVCGKLGYLK